MTTDSRFLALVAKVDADAKQFQKVMINAGNCTYEEAMAFKSASSAYRALKGEIMRHKPRPTGYRYSDNEPTGYECSWCHTPSPCKPWLDIEAEVGK